MNKQILDFIARLCSASQTVHSANFIYFFFQLLVTKPQNWVVFSGIRRVISSGTRRAAAVYKDGKGPIPNPCGVVLVLLPCNLAVSARPSWRKTPRSAS